MSKWITGGEYSTKRKFVGIRLTLVLENPPLNPSFSLLNPANRHEARIFSEVMDELKERKILRLKE